MMFQDPEILDPKNPNSPTFQKFQIPKLPPKLQYSSFSI